MSFGVSIGDLLAVTKLFKYTVSSLQASRKASNSYNNLVLSEIGSLESILRNIQDNELLTDNDAVHLAAAGCKEVLDEFLPKLKNYQNLTRHERVVDEPRESERMSKRQKIATTTRKMQWGFTMEKEVDAFRGRLAPRIMCLQVALTTASLCVDCFYFYSPQFLPYFYDTLCVLPTYSDC